VAGLLTSLVNRDGILTLANAAVRRREDPFDALDALRGRPAPSADDVQRRFLRAAQEERRWDSSHPSDALRIRLVLAQPTPGSRPPLLDVPAADADLRRLRPQLAKQIRDDLLDL
jgi:hypothetical protein